ncbi:hypothetical protein CN692_14140 [Bacillus sp. AFS002410]|uniref:hypothetical protein n=1 Tax=Bacillus sp. AFS002410 TaxID=2033481 RepID=UPI000BF03E25|nr:hypothetical protein [Bacillus sp. AFS002410]PEJ57287.1 hypothetical protein CN692_14140 [Bacillus sp. AFS002410]
MKKIYETQKPESKVMVDDDKIFSPIEDLQKMQGVIPFKRNSLELGKQPRAIRFIGYFFIGFIVISTLVLLIANLLYN